MTNNDRTFNDDERELWEELKKNAERLIVSHANLRNKIQELRDVNTGLVATIVDLRSVLEDLRGRGYCFCQSGDNPFLSDLCSPQCKKAMAALKRLMKLEEKNSG